MTDTPPPGILARCDNGHEQHLLTPDYDRARAAQLAGLIDGTSPLYQAPPPCLLAGGSVVQGGGESAVALQGQYFSTPSVAYPGLCYGAAAADSSQRGVSSALRSQRQPMERHGHGGRVSRKAPGVQLRMRRLLWSGCQTPVPHGRTPSPRYSIRYVQQAVSSGAWNVAFQGPLGRSWSCQERQASASRPRSVTDPAAPDDGAGKGARLWRMADLYPSGV